ncbi:hypothetical protein [Actinomadura flavalba]|uniref:hypothetical protein n=1 Tax=Actinomadura flavalba TaxID=1120938 RepID=UPI000380813B|nr:hypothetical protein [Actinomadura flavalba]
MQTGTPGKISLDHIYRQPDPRAYFGTLRGLGYCIPQLAQPAFATLIAEHRAVHGTTASSVLDIGCSYGINAALTKCGATMDELYERYAGDDAAALTRDTLLDRDRALLRARRRPGAPRFTGLDVSADALAYALAAGYLDEAVHADLEAADPTPDQARRLAGADVVISTGCLGYVTDRTLSRVIAAQDGRLPWMAHYVLRMFSFAPIADTLDAAGYTTEAVGAPVRQRRFATDQERDLVLDAMTGDGIDPSGYETDGWFYAQLHVSRPRHPTTSTPTEERP